MQLTACCKLLPTQAQQTALRSSMAEFAIGQMLAAKVASASKCADARQLHHLCYYSIRAATPLGANMVCNAERRVAGAYKTMMANGEIEDGKAWPEIEFSPMGAMKLDARTFSLKGDEASLWSLEGRLKVRMVLGKRQRQTMAKGKIKTADVVCKRGKWYLHLSIALPKAATDKENTKALGVDVGENTLAATSEGKILGGEKIRHRRDVWLARRRALQSNGSQSAMQRLRKASGTESRHVRHINHEESKKIVAEATLHRCGIVGMENLTHIRSRIKMGKRMRARLHRWAWRQLQSFIDYKAQQAGIRTVYVNPAYTSQACSQCLCLGTRRKHLFSCQCGNSRHADSNAAKNIRRLAEAIATATRPVRAGKVAQRPQAA